LHSIRRNSFHLALC